MSDIEQVMLGHDEFESVYTRTGGDDEIGVVQINPVIGNIVAVLKRLLKNWSKSPIPSQG